jgi:hypothetical protein
MQFTKDMIKQILASVAAVSVLLVGVAASAEENPGNRAGGAPASARIQAETLKNMNPRATVPGDRYCVEPVAFGLPYRAEHPYVRSPSQPSTPSNQRTYQPNAAGRTPAPNPGGYR